jgi:hypothetical protein
MRLAGMAACYVLGMVTIYAWQQVLASTPGETQVLIPQSPSSPKTPAAVQIVKQPDVPSAPGPAPRPAKKSRFDSLRELGDRHLIAERNPEQALRCYRVALRYATEEEFIAASHQGTWLLRAICLDSKQEKDHASKKS